MVGGKGAGAGGYGLVVLLLSVIKMVFLLSRSILFKHEGRGEDKNCYEQRRIVGRLAPYIPFIGGPTRGPGGWDDGCPCSGGGASFSPVASGTERGGEWRAFVCYFSLLLLALLAKLIAVCKNRWGSRV